MNTRSERNKSVVDNSEGQSDFEKISKQLYDLTETVASKEGVEQLKTVIKDLDNKLQKQHDCIVYLEDKVSKQSDTINNLEEKQKSDEVKISKLNDKVGVLSAAISVCPNNSSG